MEIFTSTETIVQGVFNQGTLCNINLTALHLKNKQRKYSTAHQKQGK